MKHEELTQKYSTWGHKLLQNLDVLEVIQNKREFRPITVQLAPTESCDSDCAFCSVASRPLKSKMPFADIVSALTSFKKLGAKSLEITGGGNPMLYSHLNVNINHIIVLAKSLGYKIGIITNSHDFKMLSEACYDDIDWIRVSLIKLDEGYEPEDYNFRGFPEEKIGFSYIIYDGVEQTPRRGDKRDGTTINSIKNIQKLIEIHPKTKFVRIAGNCLIKGDNADVRDKWKPIIDEIDKNEKFFIKDIGNDDGPYEHACYVGAIRPYIAPRPHGNGYAVYTCTSHVLNKRTYDTDYELCDINDIERTWQQMNDRFKSKGYPYEVKCNGGNGWAKTCEFCYYKNNNAILHSIATPLPDREFA